MQERAGWWGGSARVGFGVELCCVVLRRIVLGEVTVSRIVDPNGGSPMGHLSEFVLPVQCRATFATGCYPSVPVLVEPVRAHDTLKLEHTKSHT